MMLSLDTAYRSFGGEVEASSTPTICRLSDSRRHQLWAIALERIHHALYEQCREREQREASPTAAIIDSQSVKSAEKGGRALIHTGTMRARSDNEDVALRSRQEAAHSCR